MRTPHRFLAALLLLTACESPANPEPRETSFTFEYRIGGGAWQSFAARGQQPPGTSFSTPGPWVYTGVGGRHVILQPWQQHPEGWARLHLIVTPSAGDTIFVGHYSGETCPEGRPCTTATYVVRSAGGDVLEGCMMLTGAVVLTRVSDAWISGKISGNGRCDAGDSDETFELRDGRFDIALPPPASAPG